MVTQPGVLVHLWIWGNERATCLLVVSRLFVVFPRVNHIHVGRGISAPGTSEVLNTGLLLTLNLHQSDLSLLWIYFISPATS